MAEARGGRGSAVNTGEFSSVPTLVRVVQAPHEGMIVCRAHLREIAVGVVLAHEEIPTAQARFWGDRCLMCGVAAVPGRRCANVDCGDPLHPQWPAVYCCDECALEDA